jgi:hypothetical protein
MQLYKKQDTIWKKLLTQRDPDTLSFDPQKSKKSLSFTKKYLDGFYLLI